MSFPIGLVSVGPSGAQDELNVSYGESEQRTGKSISLDMPGGEKRAGWDEGCILTGLPLDVHAPLSGENIGTQI